MNPDLGLRRDSPRDAVVSDTAPHVRSLFHERGNHHTRGCEQLYSLLDPRHERHALGLRSYEVIPEVVRSIQVASRGPLDRKRLGPGKKLIDPVKVQGEILDADHARNFKTCNCDIETGHRSTSATLLGNIALRSNSVIGWDAEQERVTNHSKANDLLSYRYRSPWRLA